MILHFINIYGISFYKYHQKIDDQLLTLTLLEADLANTKWCKKPENLLKPCHMGTHLWVFSESYPMNTNTTRFRWFSKICACTWSNTYKDIMRNTWLRVAMQIRLNNPSPNIFQIFLYLVSYVHVAYANELTIVLTQVHPSVPDIRNICLSRIISGAVWLLLTSDVNKLIIATTSTLWPGTPLKPNQSKSSHPSQMSSGPMILLKITLEQSIQS